MFSDPLLILGWLCCCPPCTAHCWPLSNRLLCVARYGECACVCVCFRVLVFRLRGELARNREYDGDDDYYCCCCCSSTTPTPAGPAAMLQLLVLRDATGMCAVAATATAADDDKGRSVAATTRLSALPEECGWRQMWERRDKAYM